MYAARHAAPSKNHRITGTLTAAALLSVAVPATLLGFPPSGWLGRKVLHSLVNAGVVPPEMVFHEGWMRTGDLGKMDAYGYFSIVERAKDVIIASGLKVYPREVE